VRLWSPGVFVFFFPFRRSVLLEVSASDLPFTGAVSLDALFVYARVSTSFRGHTALVGG